MPPRPRIILFTRLPRAGRVKTRLIPALEAKGAARLHQAMTERSLAWMNLLARRRPVDLEVRTTGGTPEQARDWLGPGPAYTDQGSGGLGRRMAAALGEALAAGAPAAVLIGTDAPGRDDEVLARALDALARHDLVLGPARDGGYYLVGLRRPVPGLFAGVEWGTPRVLAQTLARADAAGLSWSLLPCLDDVDRPQDLPVWEAAPPPPEPGLISVIIPCLNEAPRLAACAGPLLGRPGVEALVVDGGSRDGTPARARDLGLAVCASPPGRGEQMARGAARARGEYLVFLHADTILPPGWEAEVRRILDRPGTALGAFSFAIDLGGASVRLIEAMVHLRSRLAGLPYGDQALFLRAATLRLLGGFPRRPLMEDVELVRRARAWGRVEMSPLKAISSSRRWQRDGVWRNTFRNWTCFLRYRLGAEPGDLARWYYGHRP